MREMTAPRWFLTPGSGSRGGQWGNRGAAAALILRRDRLTLPKNNRPLLISFCRQIGELFSSTPRRFPPSLTVDETNNACFIVRDKNEATKSPSAKTEPWARKLAFRIGGELYFSWVEMLLNVAVRFVSRVFTAAMIATEMPPRSGRIRWRSRRNHHSQNAGQGSSSEAPVASMRRMIILCPSFRPSESDR